MFGCNTKREKTDADSTALPPQLLQSLSGIDLEQTALLTQAARCLNYSRGVIIQHSHDDVAYLIEGSLRIVSSLGNVRTLTADQPGARFPLPAPDRVSHIEASAPSKLLWLPRAILATSSPPPPAPAMNARETDALDELNDFFSSPNYELPSLPDLAAKIGAAIDRDNTTNDDIARLIQLDPVLTTRMLGVVNSAAFGGVSRVTSIQQATTRLGRNKVRSLVFSCLLKSIFKVPSGNLHRRMSVVWRNSVQVAALSYVLAKATPDIDPEQALLAGLVHDIGAVALIGAITRFPPLAERDTTFEYILESLRITSALRIINHWGLQQEVGEVVRECHDWMRVGTTFADTTDVVIIARMHAAFGTPYARDLPPIDRLPAFHKLADGQLTARHSLAVLERARADVREIRALITA